MKNLKNYLGSVKEDDRILAGKVLDWLCWIGLVLTLLVFVYIQSANGQNDIRSDNFNPEISETEELKVFRSPIEQGSDANWGLQNLSPGVDNEVHVTLRDGDYLYIGGNFENAGGIDISNLVRFDLIGQEWEDLGILCSSDCVVKDLLFHGDYLYAAGNFESVGPDNISAGNIARYHLQNQVWESLGSGVSTSGSIEVLAYGSGYIFSGGSFSEAGGSETSNIAAYHISSESWVALGNGSEESVSALAVWDESLFIGSNNVVREFDISSDPGDDENWSVFAEVTYEFQDLTPRVRDLFVWNDHLFIGGEFNTVAEEFTFSLASYNFIDETWTAYPDGRFDVSENIVVDSNGIFVSTPDILDTSDETPSVLMYTHGEEDPEWIAFGVGAFNDSVFDMSLFDGQLYFGGSFTRAGSQNNVGSVAGYDTGAQAWFSIGAKWGQTEAALSGGDVHSLIIHKGDVIAGGNFTTSGSGDLARIGLFDRDSGTWEPLDNGIADGTVYALAANENYIFAGGDFTELGNGQSASGIAVYNRQSSSWSPLGAGIGNSDTTPVIYALELVGDLLFAGGAFDMANNSPASNLFQYHIDNQNWDDVDGGTNGTVYSLHYSRENLYTGGGFTTAGSLSASAFAWFDLSEGSWMAPDSGPELSNGQAGVYAIESLGMNQVYVAGHFETAGSVSASNVARLLLDTGEWESLDTGIDGITRSLHIYGDNVFAGGSFESAGQTIGSNILRFNWDNGRWHNLGGGTDGAVNSLFAFGDELYLGGGFSAPASGFTSWTGVSGFIEGIGSAEEPFLVSNTNELERVRFFPDKHFVQTADIGFAGGSNFRPIGNPDLPFTGNYDGGDYAITNLRYDTWPPSQSHLPRSYIGLFGYLNDAEIANVHLVGAFFRVLSPGNFVGGMAGYAENSRISSSSVTGIIRGSTHVGGFIGAAFDGTVINSSFFSYAPGTNFNLSSDVVGISNVGGFIGTQDGSEISDAFAHGRLSVTGSENDNIGGFVGSISGNDAEINSAYTTMEVSGGGSASNSGGFAGLVEGALLQNVYIDTDLSDVVDEILADTLSTAEMMMRGSFEFNFEDRWDIRDGVTFPFLRNNNETGVVGSTTFGTVVLAGTEINGEEGWRYYGLSFPGNRSYSEFTRSLLTQGVSGADISTGVPNVFNYSNSNNSWMPIPGINVSGFNLNRAPESNPFALFVFMPDFQDELDIIPVVSMYRKPYQEDEEPVLGFNVNQLESETEITGGVWTLMANNNLRPVSFDGFEVNGLSEVVYVYDPSIPGYISWNGQSGDLTDGIIQPFQGFFMETLDSNAEINIPSSALITDQTIPSGMPTELPSLRLQAKSDAKLISSAWVGFNDGNPAANARKLLPMDQRPFAELAIVDNNRLLDSKNLAIDLDDKVKLPVSLTFYDVGNNGWTGAPVTFELSWSGLEKFPDDWSILLHNSSTNEFIDLKLETTFEYVSAGNVNQHRFGDGGLAPGSKPEEITTDLFLIIVPGSFDVEPEDNQLPEKVTLAQNYPNPFNPVTSIEFGIPESQNVKLEVYNLLGRRVATLVSQSMEAGTHTVQFDASALSSGLYVYRLRTNGQVLTRKMMLVK